MISALLTASTSGVVQKVIDALSSGSLYAMFALGIALIFGIVGLVNFAQGSVIMVAAYALLVAASWPILGKLGLALAAAIAVSMLVDRVAFRPIREAPPTTLLVTAFVMGSLLQATAEIIDNNRPRSVDVSAWLDGSFHVGSTFISRVSVITLVSTVLIMVALSVYLKRARSGLQMRAAAENFQMAQALGVRANRVIALAFALSGILAGIGAFFFIAQTGAVSPTIGVTPLLFGFIGTIIGRLGSLPGAVAGGFLLGVATVLLQVLLPDSLAPYQTAFLFGFVILLLVTRPQGLFGGTSTERV